MKGSISNRCPGAFTVLYDTTCATYLLFIIGAPASGAMVFLPVVSQIERTVHAAWGDKDGSHCNFGIVAEYIRCFMERGFDLYQVILR